MILTWRVPTTQPRELLDALNKESGRVYTRVCKRHWRFYKKHGVWLTCAKAENIDDKLSPPTTLLHSHSIDAAQQGFYKAIKTARTLRKTDPQARFPRKRKKYRTTIFKTSQIKRVEDHQVRLAMAKRQYLYVTLPKPLQEQEGLQIKEVRLVYNRKGCRYDWHLVIDDATQPSPRPGQKAMSVDLGEIHPAVCATQLAAAIVSCRELRSAVQHRNKVLAELSSKMSRCNKGSRRWHKLRRAKVERRAYFERKRRDLEHKVSRCVVNLALEWDASVIALGDVKHIGVGKRLARKSQQKISQWSHGRIRGYIEYKAAREGMGVVLVNEAYTTQTCPQCSQRHKPRGRVYDCKSCGFVGHRDVVGASNILARHEMGDVGGYYPEEVGYKHAQDCRKTKKKQKVSGVGASRGSCGRALAQDGHVAWEQLFLF